MAEFRIEFWPERTPIAPIAFLTMARDETFMLKAWISNGLRISPDAEFFVLDHASVPALSETLADFIAEVGAKVNFTRLPSIPFDDSFKAMALSGQAKMLVQCFDVVVTTDCDELLVGLGVEDSKVLPKLQELGGITAPIGFEIVQHTSRENAFDLTLPIENQRAYGFLTSGYSKPVIWRQRSEFGGGLHSVRDDFDYDSSLALLHLRSVDAEVSAARASDRRAYALSQEQVKSGRGSHWWTPTDKKIDIFGRLANQEVVREYSDIFTPFFDVMTSDHGKNSSGFFRHNISQNSDICHAGGLIYTPQR